MHSACGSCVKVAMPTHRIWCAGCSRCSVRCKAGTPPCRAAAHTCPLCTAGTAPVPAASCGCRADMPRSAMRPVSFPADKLRITQVMLAWPDV